MKRISFCDFADLAEAMSATYASLPDECADVSLIAKYEEAAQSIKELLCMGHDIASLDIHTEKYENYADEYCVSLTGDGIYCEKFKRERGYFYDKSSVIYIMDNCNSKVIPYCKGDAVYEVSIGENNKENDEAISFSNDTQNTESVYVSRSKDGTPDGFSKSWSTIKGGIASYSSYSYYSEDIDMLKSVASDFGVEL